ncbi:MAG: ParB/RepB/Spo0J family partition protein [Microthrixaceae bacterium]
MNVGRRSGLGRGLDALIPPTDENDHDEATGETTTPPGGVLQVPVDQVRANPYQPRVDFDDESIDGLAASIAALGVLQPLLVRPAEEGIYHLIAGERRWRAARRAGLETVPVLVRLGGDQAALEEALVENLHREDLNPLEEAAGIRQLMDEFGLSHDDAAVRLGRSRPAVTNLLRLLQLPAEVQRVVRDGLLSAGAARAVLSLPDEASQVALATRAVDDGLSVRAVEELVRTRHELAERVPSARPGRGGSTTGAPRSGSSASGVENRPAGAAELEALLSDRLATEVSVELTAKRGRILVEFADLDDLERIYRTIIGDE